MNGRILKIPPRVERRVYAAAFREAGKNGAFGQFPSPLPRKRGVPLATGFLWRGGSAEMRPS